MIFPDKTDELKIPDLPPVADFPEWKHTVLRKTTAASSQGDAAFAWVKRAMEETASPEELSHVSPEYLRLDHKLAAALLQVCHQGRKTKQLDPFRLELAQRILQATEDATNNDRLLKGREMLRIIAKHYSVRQELRQIMTIRDLDKVQLTRADSDHALRQWLAKWTTIVSRFDKPPTGDTLISIREMFVDQLKKCNAMRDVMLMYNTSPEDSSVRTYDWLREQAFKYLDRQLMDYTRKEVEKGLSSSSGLKMVAQALPVEGKSMRTCNAFMKTGKCSAGKNCKFIHDYKARENRERQVSAPRPSRATTRRPQSRPRSAAPASKGTKLTPRGPCYAFSRGSCKKGGTCDRSHVALSEDQKRQRDEWEKRTLKAGKRLPYEVPRSAAPGPPAKPSTPRRRSSTPPPSKQTVCKFYEKGECKFGDKCKFLHKKS